MRSRWGSGTRAQDGAMLHTGRMLVAVTLARADDAEEIGEFQTACWEQTYRGVVSDDYLNATTALMRGARWRERITRGQRRVLIARSAGDILGVASTASTDPSRSDLPGLELCSIYVDQRFHSTGISSDLMSAAVGQEDAHLLVFTTNRRAQRFYAKYGFVATGEHQIDPDTAIEEQRWVRLRPTRADRAPGSA